MQETAILRQRNIGISKAGNSNSKAKTLEILRWKPLGLLRPETAILRQNNIGTFKADTAILRQTTLEILRRKTLGILIQKTAILRQKTLEILRRKTLGKKNIMDGNRQGFQRWYVPIKFRFRVILTCANHLHPPQQ